MVSVRGRCGGVPLSGPRPNQRTKENKPRFLQTRVAAACILSTELQDIHFEKNGHSNVRVCQMESASTHKVHINTIAMHHDNHKR